MTFRFASYKINEFEKKMSTLMGRFLYILTQFLFALTNRNHSFAPQRSTTLCVRPTGNERSTSSTRPTLRTTATPTRTSWCGCARLRCPPSASSTATWTTRRGCSRGGYRRGTTPLLLTTVSHRTLITAFLIIIFYYYYFIY